MRVTVQLELVSKITIPGVDVESLLPCADKKEALKKLGLERLSDVVETITINFGEEKR